MEINLTEYRINHHSQLGEDGVIEKLFSILNIKDGWLVEFGAWDGIYLSNTYYHYRTNSQFNLLALEPVEERFQQLNNNFGDTTRTLLLNKKVELSGQDSLNNIFKENNIDDIALLSIDVDGEDFEIWKSLDKTRYKPKIVIIEFGKWTNEQELNLLQEQFKEDGYTLICITGNFIFIRDELNITSKQNIHELFKASSHPEYLLFYGPYNKDEFNKAIECQNSDNEYYSKVGLPQLIFYNEA